MLRLARIAAVHPEDHSVDLVMIDDGSRHVGVQVAAPSASSDTGVFDMPEPSAIASKFSLSERRPRDSIAVVAMLQGLGGPIVLGFLYPQVNGMLFADKERRVMRHASDVYTSIDSSGNVEIAHPNGTYLRIGATPEHEDLSGKDFDGNWAINRNKTVDTHIQVVVAASGVEKAKLHIDPAGNVTLEHVGNLTVNTTGNAEVNVGGTAAIDVGGAATIDVGGTTQVTSAGAVTVQAPSVTLQAAQTTCTGALTVQGLLTYQAGLAGSGGSGATMTGSLNVTGNVSTTGTLTNNSKAVGSTHVHTGVTSGSGVSGTPA